MILSGNIGTNTPETDWHLILEVTTVLFLLVALGLLFVMNNKLQDLKETVEAMDDGLNPEPSLPPPPPAL